jgi:hypothetical protein
MATNAYLTLSAGEGLVIIDGTIGFNTTVLEVTANTSLTANDYSIVFNNLATNITVILPNALTMVGHRFFMARFAGSTGNITLQRSSTNLIQNLGGTTTATSSIAGHGGSGNGLSHQFVAVNIAGIGYWLRM